jgi:membrane fusion protein (multidrug efflux system)
MTMNNFDSPRPSKSPLWRRLSSFVVCTAVLGGAAWWILRKPGTPLAAAGPMMAATGPIPVRVETVQPMTVPLATEYLGQTVAFQKVEVRARVAAFLSKRLFEEGTMVKEGQELFRLERDTFEADLEAAKASLGLAEARVEQTERAASRLEHLFAEMAVSQKDLDDARTDLRVAQAAVLLAKARLRQANLTLSYTVILSPLTGMVGKASKDVGSYLNPQSDGPLALVQQVDPLYVEFPIAERDLLLWQELAGGGRQKEISVELTLPDGKRYGHEGKVNFVDVSVEPQTGTAAVRATVVNPDGLLRPGQLLRVKVIGLDRKNVLTVPQGAVIQSSVGAMVYVVDEKNIAQPAPVSLGDWAGDRWVVEQGLQVGTRVIVDHLMQVRPGSAVQPTTAAAGDDPTHHPELSQESRPTHAR